MGFKRKYLVEIRFKSGNVLRVWLRSITANITRGNLNALEWTVLKDGPNPFVWIDVGEIEHIGVVKKGWFWSWR